MLWVTSAEVHVVSDEDRVALPDRPLTWQKENGAYVGWLLPGAVAGTGKGRRETAAGSARLLSHDRERQAHLRFELG